MRRLHILVLGRPLPGYRLAWRDDVAVRLTLRLAQPLNLLDRFCLVDTFEGTESRVGTVVRQVINVPVQAIMVLMEFGDIDDLREFGVCDITREENVGLEAAFEEASLETPVSRRSCPPDHARRNARHAGSERRTRRRRRQG